MLSEKKIEILAPAGSVEGMKAAFNAGADAVYMGGSRFGARAYADNPDEDGEWAIMEWKDSLGLRGCGFFHVKDNKIVFQRGYWDKLSFLKQHNLPIE